MALKRARDVVSEMRAEVVIGAEKSASVLITGIRTSRAKAPWG